MDFILFWLIHKTKSFLPIQSKQIIQLNNRGIRFFPAAQKSSKMVFSYSLQCKRKINNIFEVSFLNLDLIFLLYYGWGRMEHGTKKWSFLIFSGGMEIKIGLKWVKVFFSKCKKNMVLFILTTEIVNGKLHFCAVIIDLVRTQESQNISYPLIRTCMRAYQGVRNVSFQRRYKMGDF